MSSSSSTELWISDGTFTGTQRFVDVYPDGNPSVRRLLVANENLFFIAEDGSHGEELWVSDGTITGTMLLKDINLTGDSSPDDLGIVNGELYFTADDGVHGTELWKSDGTITGTLLVADITEGSMSTAFASVEIPNNVAYLTNRVAEDSSTTFIWSEATDSAIFFVVDDATYGRELWVSDGTAEGTNLVKEINPNGNAFTDYQTTLTGYRNKLYFSATDGLHGVELWESDGTFTGTHMIKDLNPSGDSFGHFTAGMDTMGDTLFFPASDGETGFEVWALDIQAEVQFDANEYFVYEDGTEVIVTVTLDAPLKYNEVKMDFSTIDGSAVAGNDYLSRTGSLNFPIGHNVLTFTVPILDDDVFEQDETIILNLSNFDRGISASSPLTATITINDEDYSIYLPMITKGK